MSTNATVINVKDAPYNAQGDGRTDDTGSVNAAVAALQKLGGGVLYFPAGIFRLLGRRRKTTRRRI